MNVRAPRRTHAAWGVLLLALTLTGCRTYGGDYGVREAMLSRIEQANQRFAESLERARGEREALQRAARSNPALTPLAARYAAVVARQEETVETHRMMAEGLTARSNILFTWVGPDAYRTLHNTYGAIISDQRILQDRYDKVLRAVEQAVGGSDAARTAPEEGRYQLIPPFYQRLQHERAYRSVSDILTRTRPATPAPAEETADEEAVGETPASEE